jgi:tRNA G18 (ribose-2'-O)-methylase SpoU
MSRGYYAVGIYQSKTEANVGTLWRSATLYGAAFVFTVGRRYRRQASDTPKTPMHTPLFHFDTLTDLTDHLPFSCPLIGVELADRAKPLATHSNSWERCAYLLGAEDHGLPATVLDQCHSVLQIETLLPQSLNVAVAGSIILHDRHVKRLARAAERAA